MDDARPTRFVLEKDDDTKIDMHPVVFGDDGIGRQLVPDGKPFLYPQGAFAQGKINGQTIPCLSAGKLADFHLGYEPLDKDRHNMKVLNEQLGVDLPDGYKPKAS